MEELSGTPSLRNLKKLSKGVVPLVKGFDILYQFRGGLLFFSLFRQLILLRSKYCINLIQLFFFYKDSSCLNKVIFAIDLKVSFIPP